MTIEVISSSGAYLRACARHRRVYTPTISTTVGDYIVECIPRPRQIIFREAATGKQTWQPLAPTLYTLAVLLLRRCQADPLASRIFITLEEAMSNAYPKENTFTLDRVTRRRIGRQINRLSEVIDPYFTLVNIHRDHRCIGYQLSVLQNLPT